jgi:hypothetical protein
MFFFLFKHIKMKLYWNFDDFFQTQGIFAPLVNPSTI